MIRKRASVPRFRGRLSATSDLKPASDHARWLAKLQAEFEQGFRAPLLTAVVYCEQKKLPIPDWARLGLAKAFAMHLGFYDNSGKWMPDGTGCTLGRRSTDSRDSKKRPRESSLDAQLGIFKKNHPDEAALQLWPYIQKYIAGELPKRQRGKHGNLREISQRFEQLNDEAQIRYIQNYLTVDGKVVERQSSLTEKSAAKELARQRGDDHRKLYNRLQTRKLQRKRRRST